MIPSLMIFANELDVSLRVFTLFIKMSGGREFHSFTVFGKNYTLTHQYATGYVRNVDYVGSW
jgi:hypothetical protein